MNLENPNFSEVSEKYGFFLVFFLASFICRLHLFKKLSPLLHPFQQKLGEKEFSA
jgi:hypothetical protein